MKPGKYTAKAVDYGFTETRSGKPQAAIKFEVMEGPEAGETITWFGSLSPNGKGLKFTLKTFVVCGMTTNDYRKVGEGVIGGALPMNHAVQIDVQDETYEGKTRTKVKWVNPLREATFISPDKAHMLPDKTGDIMALRQELGMPLQSGGGGWQ